MHPYILVLENLVAIFLLAVELSTELCIYLSVVPQKNVMQIFGRHNEHNLHSTPNL